MAITLGKQARNGLLALGAALVVIGVLGAVLDWGATAGKPGPAASGATATTATTAAIGAGAPTQAETPAAFAARFVTALKGDPAFLVSRLHPAVIARYGAAQCQAYAPKLVDPTTDLRLIDVSKPGTFVYASDGKSAAVDNTYTFAFDGSVQGLAGTREYHFALVDGTFRIFVDCGDAR